MNFHCVALFCCCFFSCCWFFFVFFLFCYVLFCFLLCFASFPLVAWFWLIFFLLGWFLWLLGGLLSLLGLAYKVRSTTTRVHLSLFYTLKNAIAVLAAGLLLRHQQPPQLPKKPSSGLGYSSTGSLSVKQRHCLSKERRSVRRLLLFDPRQTVRALTDHSWPEVQNRERRASLPSGSRVIRVNFGTSNRESLEYSRVVSGHRSLLCHCTRKQNILRSISWCLNFN